MSDQAHYTLSVNRKTGELQVQSEQRPESNNVNKELGRVIDQQLKSKYFTLYLIISFLVAFVFVAVFKDDIKFVIGLIVLTIAAILGYIVVNYIDYLSIQYIMDTIYKIVQKPQNEESKELTDHKPDLPNNLLDEKKKKKNNYF